MPSTPPPKLADYLLGDQRGTRDEDVRTRDEDPIEIAIRKVGEGVLRFSLAQPQDLTYCPKCNKWTEGTCNSPEHLSEEERAEAERQRADAEAASLERMDAELADLYGPRGGRPPGSKSKPAEKRKKAALERVQRKLAENPNATDNDLLFEIMFFPKREITRGPDKWKMKNPPDYKSRKHAQRILGEFREQRLVLAPPGCAESTHRRGRQR